jgi:hypothetical protein
MATNAQKTKESTDWFIDKARSAAGYRKNIIHNDKRGRDDTAIGRMYFFAYDPKHKDKLPVYDNFPLVFPIERYGDGFLGLNLHYLGEGERAWLLKKLSEFANNSKFDRTTVLKLTYNLLQSTKKLSKTTRPCIKRYLFDHCYSKFIEVLPEEWEKAINLPVAQFVYKK